MDTYFNIEFYLLSGTQRTYGLPANGSFELMFDV